MKTSLTTLLILCLLLVSGCTIDITNSCALYREAVGPEVGTYANADGVVTPDEAAILKADTDFQAEIKAGPTIEQAKRYSAVVGTPWLKWVDADTNLDAAKKKRRHNTKEDFDRAMQAVETGK